MEYIPAKTIVTKNKNMYWFGADYNMNIYRGCCHSCIYCDSRSGCYRIDDFDTVKAKKNALEVIQNDLKSKKKTGVIATGAMSDPYNPFEEKEKLTRNSLKLIDAYGFGIAITTKSTLITRDVDILKNIKAKSPVIIKITVTTADDFLCKKIEPDVSTSGERFNALKILSDNEIYCGILLMPILPFINDTAENITEILNKAQNSGAKFVYPFFGLTLRDNQRDYYYQKLDELFPGVKGKYIKQYGTRYSCTSPQAKNLYSLFANQCSKLGLAYKMEDIIKCYKQEYDCGQINLF